jgi:hypothetical protein
MITVRGLAVLALCAALLPDVALAQQSVGVVTAVTGPVMIARATDAPAEPLRFRDAINLRDRVTTGDRAMTRILLGGRVVVTARERSAMTLTEVASASTIDIASGRVAITVDRAKLAAGELVEVRTPHAVTAVGGDTLIVEVRADHSSFTVLGGRIEVFRTDPVTGAPLEPPTIVGTHHTISVKDGGISRPRPVTAAQALQLAEDFTPPVRPVAALALGIVRDELARALEALAAAKPPASTIVPPLQPVITQAVAPAAAQAPAPPPPRVEARPARHVPSFFELFGAGTAGRFRDRDGGPRR